MTLPALATPLTGLGRHYPWPPADLSDLPRKYVRKDVPGSGSVSPRDIPDDVTMYPSVTNVLDVMDKPALRGWYAEHALRAAWESFLDNGGDFPFGLDAFIKDHKWAANKVRDQRAEAGTSAHTIAERLTTDTPLPKHLSEADEAFADAFMAFWSDLEPEPVWVEQTVCHPQVGYAGTADLFANVKGELVVIDYKTRAKAPDDKKIKRYGLAYESNILQLAALGSATHRYVESDGGWGYDDLPLVRAGLVVVLFEDGQYRHQWVPAEQMETGFEAFCACLTVWKWKNGQ